MRKSYKEKKIIYLLILSFFLSLSILYSMMHYKNTQEINQFLKNITIQHEKIYNAIYDEFKTLSKITYQAQNTKEIYAQTLYKVKHNIEDKSMLRKYLYTQSLSDYKNLKKYQLKQLHFHTNEGKSFLRMSNPSVYDDNLIPIRPLISMIVKNQQFITGYEEGEFTGGYRYIFPIFYNDEYVGSIEYVFSSLIISKRFMDNYGGWANFLISEKVLKKYKISPEKKDYIPAHIKGFYIEKKFFNSIKRNPLSQNTIQNITDTLKQKNKFSLYDEQIKKIITIFKITDPLFKNIEGLFLIGSDSSYIFKKNRNFIFIFSIFTFFILTIHYFLYLHLMRKIFLESKIEQAIIETREKNNRIQRNEKMAAMGEMIDSIAHQWKQPISVIKMCLEMIELDILQDSLDKKYISKNIETANLQINHLIKTIDEFRNFFKPDENIQQIYLKTIIDSTLLLVKDELAKNAIVSNVNLENNLYININKNECIHVLINLINNAKDSFNENRIENRQINIFTYKNQEQTILEVCDNAGGIPQEIINKIFDSRFTTKEHMQGSGIGLYMSKQIIEKHHGRIEVYNKKEGACFKIIF